ncbi:MAG: hypothetical protein IJP75_01525 [Bacteroidaceae bacterium]|nr:hypothetical protein [Bacteroidaceae bacterium]
MKKNLFAFLLLAACWQAAVAQNTVESIRERYQAMKEYVASHQGTNQYDGADFGEFYHLESRQWLPATGGHIENTYLYYDEAESDDDVIYKPHYVKFVTTKFNYAAREFYEEYLYDKDGNVAFIYAYDPMTEFDGSLHDKQFEFRFYFNKGKLLKAIIKSKGADDAAYKEVLNDKAIKPIYADVFKQYQAKARQMRELFINIEKEAYVY